MSSKIQPFSYLPDKFSNISVVGKPLHSSYNPINEATRILADLTSDLQKDTVLIVIGIGWGYIIEEYVNSNTKDDVNILFLEPFSEIYKILIQESRLAILEEKNVSIYFQEEQILSQIKKQLKKNSKLKISFSILPSYRRIFPEKMLALQNKLQESINSLSYQSDAAKVNAASKNHFIRQWTRNQLKQFLGSSQSLLFLQELKEENDALQDKKFIYCGAAPHLATEIQFFPNDSYIMSADSALAYLIHSNRQVDLAISVDSGTSTFFHLEAMKEALLNKPHLHRPNLLSWTASLRQKAMQQFFNNIYFYRSTLPFDQILSQNTSFKLAPLRSCLEWKNPSYNSIGLAIQMAYLFQKKELFIAGVSFINDEQKTSHIRGSGYTRYAMLNQTRISPMEMYKVRGYSSNKKRSIKNQVAWDEAHKMAENLGIALRPINTSKSNHTTPKHASPRTPRNSHSLELPSCSIPSKTMSLTLMQIWKHIDQKKLIKMGIPNDLIRKCNKILGY